MVANRLSGVRRQNGPIRLQARAPLPPIPEDPTLQLPPGKVIGVLLQERDQGVDRLVPETRLGQGGRLDPARLGKEL